MPEQALTQADINQLRNYANNGTVADALNYWGFLESKGYQYATLAKDVVTGGSGFGEAARAFAQNVGLIEGTRGSIAASEWNTISVELMQADFVAVETLFTVLGRPIVRLPLDDIRRYHSDVFALHDLPASAWTVFAPTVVGNPSTAQQEAIWQDLLDLGTGGTAQEFIAAAGIGLITMFNGVLDPQASAADTQLAALWTEAVFFGPDRANPTGAIQGYLGTSSTIQPYSIPHPDGGQIVGGSHEANNIISGTGNADVLIGYGGADNLYGNDRNDTLFGNDADDRLFGGGGDDLLIGGDDIYDSRTQGGNDVLYGEAGNDTLYGGGGNDLLEGGAGNDKLDGGSNNDKLDGGDNNDTLLGGSGNDTLVAGSGKDELRGGGDNDTLVAGADTTSIDKDKLYGEAGNDTLLDHYRADKSTDSLYGGANNDILFGGKGDRLYGEGDSDTYWLNASEATDTSNTGTNTFIAWTGNAALDNQITLANTVVDKIHIKEGAATLVKGLGGNDEVYWGNTRIVGDFYRQIGGQYEYTLGAKLFANITGDGFYIYDDSGNRIATLTRSGSDVSANIWGSFAGITVHYGEGAVGAVGGYTDVPFTPDFLSAYPDPVAAGTAGNDSIPGGYLADSISSGAGNDTLAGSTGNDTLAGGNGSNTASGGGDRDTFVIAADTVAVTDTITDFNASAGEVIDVSALGSNLTLQITQTGADASFTVGNRTVLMKNVQASALTTAHFVGVSSITVKVTPTNGADSIPGTAGADTIDALGGNDTISGLGGNDSLYGNAGDDVLIGGAGADTLSGGSGSDTASYAGSAAVNVNLATGAVSGGYAAGDVFSSIEHLIGSGNADTLAGNTSGNQILGGGGNDTILGDSGNDTLGGEAGNDSLDGGSGNDLLLASTGSDAMIGGTGTDTFDYSLSTAAVILNLTTGAASGGWAAGDTLSGAEYIIGSAFNDSVTGNAENNNFLGGAGNDTLRGDAGRDTIDGGDGNDSLVGGADNDRLTDGLGANKLFGEAGNDTLTGGAGADSLDGGDGDDSLVGGAGADTLAGGLGVDTLSYATATAAVNVNLKTSTGAGSDAAGDKPSGIEELIGSAYNDTLTGGAAAETIDGGNGNNIVNGDAGADSLEGGSGLDSMNGGAGNDTLDGGSGNDSLRGGADADEIDGGSGNDLLFGDAGADTLEGGSGADTMNGGTEADIFYISTSDTGLGTAADHIVGFSRAQGDKIEFNISGISASSFVGLGAFTSGGVREFGYTKTTFGGANVTVIRLDLDNNGATDREIVLDGIHIDLVVSDFLF